MAPSPESSIVNVSSVARLRGAAIMSVYSATKATLVGWPLSLAKELAHIPIRVNAAVPRMVRIEMTENMFKRFTTDQLSALKRRHLIGFGDPIQVAAAVTFLFSDKASHLTGENIRVCGGKVMA